MRVQSANSAALLALLLLALADGPASAAEAFDWDDGPQGWYFYYEYNNGLGDCMPWLGHGGEGDSGFVFAPLDKVQIHFSAPGAHEALYTCPGIDCPFLDTAVDLTRLNQITVSLNRQPLSAAINSPAPAADLKGGKLVFFVGRFDSATRYAFYYYNRQCFAEPPAAGWHPTSISLTTNPEDWTSFDPVTHAFPVSDLLPNPQQWGIWILDAAGQPTGNLGFDNLSFGKPRVVTPVSKALPGHFTFDCGAEDWNYWFEYNPEVGDPLPWRPGGGFAAGHTWSPLQQLKLWPPAPEPTNAHFLFVTYDRQNPLSLAKGATIRARFNRQPLPARQPAVALMGSVLCFFVGTARSASDYAFYYFNRAMPVSSASGWNSAQLTLTSNPADWRLLAGRGKLPALSELLPNPPQYGFCLIGARAQPSGWLGIDALDFQVPLHVASVAVLPESNSVKLSWVNTFSGCISLRARPRGGEGDIVTLLTTPWLDLLQCPPEWGRVEYVAPLAEQSGFFWLEAE